MNKILEFFNGLNSIARTILICAVIGGIAYTAGNWGKKSEMEQYIEKYKQYEQQSKQVLAQNDSLKKIIQGYKTLASADSAKVIKQTTEIDKLKNNLNTSAQTRTKLQASIDSLKAVQPDTTIISLKKDTLITELKQEVGVATQIITKLEARDSTRTHQISNLMFALDAEKKRGDMLEATLRNIPKPPKDPDKILFGLIPKPNRIVVAAATVVVTLVAEHAIIK